MPPKNPSRPPQDVNTATISTFRPGTPVVPLSPAEHEALSETARQQGVNTAEAMKRLVEKLPQAPPRQTVSDQSLDKVERARELSLTTDDPSDPLNQMMRYGFYKDIKKEMKSGNEDRMSMREMMEMAILQRMLPTADNGSQGGSTQFQQMMSDMKAENEKNRQFYEQRLKEQEDKIRDMVFEKRIQTMEDNQAETVTNLSQQLADVSNRMELYRNIPPNPSLEEKKDAISHLEDLGGQIDRIKKALAPFGITSSQSPSLAGTGLPAQDIYKKPDGSTDYFRYAVDKLGDTVGKVSDAWQKKTPDRKQVVETPALAETRTRQTEATYRQQSPEEYADNLLSKANPTQEEQQWLNNYNTYLEQQRVKLQPRVKAQQTAELQRCGCGNPEIYRDGLCQSCWDSQTGIPDQPVKPRKGMLERLKEQEENELNRTRGLV